MAQAKKAAPATKAAPKHVAPAPAPAPNTVPTRAPVPKPVLNMEREVVHKLKPSRMHLGESRIRWWYAIVEQGTPYEALLDPVYWDSHAFKFAPGDFIMVENDEQTYTAQFRVMEAGTGGTRVAEFYKKEWGRFEPQKDLKSMYRVEFAGPHHRHRVVRIKDNHVEQSGFETEIAANRWLADNARALTQSYKAA